MASITLPIWLIVTVAGTPLALLIIVLGTRLAKRKRNKDKPDAKMIHPKQSGQEGMPGQPFHQDLFLRQIDAVFDGLAALIETERHKLKRMVDGQVAFGGGVASHGALPDASSACRQFEPNAGPDSQMSANGAESLGVSAVEAELAMKFKNMNRSDGASAIEAVV